MTMATKQPRACVRVSQAARRLERMVMQIQHRPDRVRVSQLDVILEYGLNAHQKAVQLHMWNTADRVLQLLDSVGRIE